MIRHQVREIFWYILFAMEMHVREQYAEMEEWEKYTVTHKEAA